MLTLYIPKDFPNSEHGGQNNTNDSANLHLNIRQRPMQLDIVPSRFISIYLKRISQGQNSELLSPLTKLKMSQVKMFPTR